MKIVSLPLNGRGAFRLIGLVPGVAEGVNSSTSGAPARINGGRNRLNEVQLDGITAINVKGGGGGTRPWWTRSNSSRLSPTAFRCCRDFPVT